MTIFAKICRTTFGGLFDHFDYNHEAVSKANHIEHEAVIGAKLIEHIKVYELVDDAPNTIDSSVVKLFSWQTLHYLEAVNEARVIGDHVYDKTLKALNILRIKYQTVTLNILMMLIPLTSLLTTAKFQDLTFSPEHIKM